ncbi:peptidase domain-containing ABC transporter [Priestia megaterium]|uniref:peptidase domain-containing ABC transporter n=1 Tax=Priestia megaterium TaxID=1404 RepID=UPI003241F5FB
MKNNFVHTRQQTGNDCGLACVSSILKYYGLNYGIDYLRDLIVDKKGYNVKDLMSLFKNFDEVEAKPFKVNINKIEDSLEQLNYPCIALINNNNEGHYVILYERTKTNLLISDPLNDKLKKISIQNFKNRFSGIVLQIESERVPSFCKRQSLKEFSFFKDILLQNKSIILAAFFLSVIAVIATICLSTFVKLVVDLIIPNKIIDGLGTVVLIFFGVVMLKVVFEYLRNLFIIKFSYILDKRMATQYFSKIVKLPINFFENREDGEIISKFNDSIFIRNIFSTNIITAIIDITIIMGISYFLYKINTMLFITILLPLLLLICVGFLFFEVLSRRSKDLMENRAQSTSLMVQFIRNMTTVYALNKTQYFLNFFQGTYKRQLDSQLRESKAINYNNSCRALIYNSFTIIILWVGTRQVLNESMTLGTLLLINSLALFLLSSIDRVIGMQSEFQKAMVASERFLGIINYPVIKSNNNEKIEEISKIEFRNFQFSYDNFENIIENLNLTINKYDRILLTGDSGVGKSTLVKCLTKLYKTKNQQIFVNNLDINVLDSNSIRKKILYLNENPFLFKGTIEENLCMGEKFSSEDLMNVCSITDSLKFISKLPGTMKFKLNENASNLSTGQKQRLALARALLHKPQLLILDESLSNVDESSLINIQKKLNDLDMTFIFIAHNKDAILNCNRELVFEEKKIRENYLIHNEVLRKQGV